MKTKTMLMIPAVLCLVLNMTAQVPQDRLLSTTDPDGVKALEFFKAHHPNATAQETAEFTEAVKRNVHPAYEASERGTPPSTQASCTNTDFEAGNLTGWTRSTGYNPGYNPIGCCPNPGGAQLITSGTGVDPCGGFPVVCPGGNFSLMLGDNNIGGIADRIEQTFLVSSANTNYSYKYAVVLQDPGHAVADQPSFQVDMVDANGNAIPCTFYQVSAGQGIPGFQNSQNCPGVIYKPWTTVSVDLSSYVGQNVTIRFTTYDCALGGHYGYAYIDGSCGVFKISQSHVLCNNSPSTLCAPAGFNTYTWNGPGVNNVNGQCISVSSAGIYSVQVTSVTGCSSPVIDYTVSMNPAPNANFQPSNINGCNAFVSFNNTSSNGGGSYTSYWTFGDGDTSTQASPSHTYPGYGTYTVTLYVYAQNGCSDTTSQVVTINPPPAPGLSYTGVCEGTAFQFSGSLNGNTQNAQWLWSFGNGATSALQNPAYTFPTWGAFPVSLTVTNNGCTTTITQNVNVQPGPVVSFSSTAVCLGTSTSFTNTSSVPLGTISSWAWDFNNDGVTDNTSQNPSYTFPNSGVYVVNLGATSNFGCASTATAQVTVFGLPVSNFVTQNNCFNIATTFTNNSTAPQGAFIAQYYWDFGDGTFSQVQTPTHTYSAPSTYNVRLAVTTNNSCVDTYSTPVTVNPLPVVSFAASSLCENQNAQFSGNINGSAAAAQWNWNFGGGTSSLQNPSYHFSGWGNYPVTLTATDLNGCTNQTNQTVTINPIPVIAVSANSVCMGNTTLFNNNSTIPSGNISSWSWDFNGDGVTDATTANPTNNFPSSGTYVVSVSASSNLGCISTQTTQVTVNGLPTAGFTANNNCLHAPSVFVNTSTAPPGVTFSQYIWTYGNGNTSSGQQGVYMYPTPGTYQVTLQVVTAQGCSAAVTQPITIYPSPSANFNAPNVCANQAMQFSDQSSIASGTINNWAWEFQNNGVISTSLQNPVNTFTAGGTYQVKEIVTSGFGCKDSVTKPVTVYFNPTANFHANTVCLGNAVQFTDASTNQSGYLTIWDWDFTSDGTIDNLSQNTSNTYTAAGTFLVTLQVQNNFGCQNVIKKPVRVNPTPVADFTVTSKSGCEGDMCVGMLNNSSLSGGSIASWHWDFGDHTTSNQNSPVHCFRAGTFSLSLTVVSDSGCSATKTEANAIVVYPKPHAGFDFSNTDLDVLDASTGVASTATGANGYVYFLSDGTVVSGQPNFQHTFPVEMPQIYTVVQVVTNSFGCKDTVIHLIEVKPGFTFYIPNAFSPNGDGTNDVFKGTGIGIKQYNLMIFDRWGNLVFTSNDLETGWDGTYNGKEVTLEDVFVWKVVLRDDKSREHDYKGTVSVVK